MKFKYFDYDETGRIRCSFTSAVELNAAPGIIAAPDLNPAPYYVDVSGETPAVANRPGMNLVVDQEEIAADDADTATISGIPGGAVATVNGVTLGPVADGELQITSDVPEVFAVKFALFPFLDWQGVIRAV